MIGQDQDTEKLVLAGMMSDKENLDQGIQELLDTDFTSMTYRKIFLMIAAMYNDGDQVNVGTVLVKHRDKINSFGLGVSFIQLFEQFVPSIKTHIERLKECTKARKLLGLSEAIRGAVERGDCCDDVYGNIENELIKNTAIGAERVYISPQEMSDTCVLSLRDRYEEGRREKKVIRTEFKSINYATVGLEKVDLIILSAETGGGKSAFAMNLAYQIGIVQKRPVLYLNSEMSADQMALRWNSIISHISHSKIRRGELTEEEFYYIISKSDEMTKGKLHTLTIPDLQVKNIFSETRRAVKKYGIEMLVVDYIGRMDMTNAPSKEDWQILKSAAQKLKTLAQDLGIIVVMIAQLNERGKLAQSSYMSHEADLWINLTRIEEDNLNKFYPFNMLLHLKKARNASTNKPLFFFFDGDTLSFTDKKERAEKWNKEEQERNRQNFTALGKMTAS